VSVGGALDVRDVTKRYGSQTAVNRVTLQICRGEFFCIIGPSGCGKTTLLRMVAGFAEPDSGDILVDGRSMARTPPYRRPVNMVFQNYALFPHMNVSQNVAFGLEMAGVPKAERRHRVAEMLALVELMGFEDRSPRELSGGQEQRVALARALVLKPSILLLDEPMGALDQKVRRRMQLELKRIHRETGITFVHVTHDQEEALVLADRIAVMNDSRVEQVGAIKELYHRPKTAFVAEFVGDSNVFVGRAERLEAGGVGLAVAPGQLVAVSLCEGVELGSAVRMFVRPEHVRMSRPGSGAAPGFLRGVIIEIAFLGSATRYVAELHGGAKVMADIHGERANDDPGLAIGDQVVVTWTPDSATVFANG
jgi:spermidine/putrescine ABC transporter ATP-binding subunit